MHPENGQEIIALNGRYGPYVKCGTEARTLPTGELSPLTVTLEQAVELLKQPRRRAGSQTPKALKELGKHPISEKTLIVRSGRYGPYVSDGEINASLPRGMSPEDLTIEAAVELLEARAAKILADGGVTKKRGAKKSGSTKKAKVEKPEPKEKKSKGEKKPKAAKKVAKPKGTKKKAKVEAPKEV